MKLIQQRKSVSTVFFLNKSPYSCRWNSLTQEINLSQIFFLKIKRWVNVKLLNELDKFPISYLSNLTFFFSYIEDLGFKVIDGIVIQLKKDKRK